MLASKSRTLSLTKQNKTNAILKTLYVKIIQQIWRIVANKLSYKYENSFTSWVKQISTMIRQKIACWMNFHARVYTRKNENNRCLLSLITSDDRNLKIVFLFGLYLVEFIDIFFKLLALSTCKYSFLDVLLWPFSIMHTSCVIVITHSNDSLLPGNQNTRDRFWPITCADFEQWTKIIY